MGNHKRIAAVQSSYIPWKGYFDLINSVDEFILYDDVQYTKRDWRNRNRIKTANGLVWLSIPIDVKGKYHQRMRDAKVRDRGWGKRHWRAIDLAYRKSPHFDAYAVLFEPLFESERYEYLSEVNYAFIRRTCDVLGIGTQLSWSMDYEIPEADPSAKLLALCRQAGATEYFSGPKAKAYLDLEMLADAGIQVSFMDYSRYPQYGQLYAPFEHAVTILDLLFHTGNDAPRYMQSLGSGRRKPVSDE